MTGRLRRLVLAIAFGIGTASAETIHYTAPPRQALSLYEYVFLGRVIETNGPGQWTVDPIRVWKGTWTGDRNRFRVKNNQGMDDYWVKPDEYYLFYLNEEGGDILMAASVRHSSTRSAIGVLDRLRKRPPLRLPEEAVAGSEPAPLDPDCYGRRRLAPGVEQDLVKATSVLVGRLGSAPVPGSSFHDTDLVVSGTIKGGRASRVPIHVPVHPMLAEPAKPAIWFLGPPDGEGRYPVVRSLSVTDEDKVRRHHKRWQKDGFLCSPS